MCHVLIIEDEPMIAMLLQDVFEDAGATSFAFAATECDAVELAVQNVPAVIASDVRLIEGSGPKAVEQIRAALGSIPAMFITGTPDACPLVDPLNVVLVKPVSVDQLTEAFAQIAPAPRVA
jgi:CheY-like chemotaxis protein